MPRLFDETQRLFKAEQERVAELQIINSIQQGLAAELDFQAIVDLVGDKLRQVFDTPDLGINWYDENSNLLHFLYTYEHDKRLKIPSAPPRAGGTFQKILKTRKPLILNTVAEMLAFGVRILPGTDQSKSMISVPIVSNDHTLGSIEIDNFERENAFGESELRLLTTIAASLGTALENARLFDETQRLFKAEQERVAELAIINSAQAALAAKLEMQGIYDAIGDKVREIFDAQIVVLGIRDQGNQQVYFPYVIENGKRITMEPLTGPYDPVEEYWISTRQPLLINEDFQRRWEELYKAPVEDAVKSCLGVPLFIGDELLGGISLQNSERENAFSESDVRLLQTLASSMSVALENARLFDEIQRLLKITEDRAAELAIINSVSEGLVRELDFQAIIDLVGEKIRQDFKVEDMYIAMYDADSNIMTTPYYIEHGDRYPVEPAPLNYGFAGWTIKNRKTLVINENIAQQRIDLGLEAKVIGDEDEPDLTQSVVCAPIWSSGKVIGNITLYANQPHAFPESSVSLLTTLAANLGVALQNARLFDETQRLLKETEERNTELAVINSVQEGLVAKMDMQGIYDLVGDKIRDIFDAQSIFIMMYDSDSDTASFPYNYEKGERYYPEPRPLTGISGHVINTRQPLMINENMNEREEEILGYRQEPMVGEDPKSRLDVPMLVGGEAKGTISLQNIDREQAFSDSDLRLLTTLVNSMSVALENARLFDETQRLLKETEERNAELAVITSVQHGLASKLEMQAIYDLIGDQIREIFDTQSLYIAVFDHEAGIDIIPYDFEDGERFYPESTPLSNFERHMIQTPQSVMINEDMINGTKEFGMELIPGTDAPKSGMWVPLIAGRVVRGVISIQNLEHEHAYSDSDLRLLETLTNSMSVALENARLFDETQRLLKETEQRAAELALINGVQQGLASKLDIQAIIDLVGDKIRDVFDTQTTYIALHDKGSKTFHIPYYLHQGNRVAIDGNYPNDKGPTGHIIQTRETLLFNIEADRRTSELGATYVADDDIPLSWLGVPMIAGDEVVGVVSLQNIEREYAYSESDVSLLKTIASSLAVALQNAQLFEETNRLLNETEQRAQELAIINSVQEGLASKLDMQAIFDLVGDKIQSMFNAQSVLISSFDHEKQVSRLDYGFENGERIVDDELLPFSPMNKHLISTRQPVVINENAVEATKQYGLKIVEGTQQAQSLIFVPFGTGTQVNGYFSLQNFDRENAFSDSDVRLLQTLAGSMGIALENARLFNAEQQRARELAAISTVSQALVAETELASMIQLIGNQTRDTFHADIAYLALLDSQANIINFPYQYGENFMSLKLGEGLTSKIIQSGEPLLINKDIKERRATIGCHTGGKGIALLSGCADQIRAGNNWRVERSKCYRGRCIR